MRLHISLKVGPPYDTVSEEVDLEAFPGIEDLRSALALAIDGLKERTAPKGGQAA